MNTTQRMRAASLVCTIILTTAVSAANAQVPAPPTPAAETPIAPGSELTLKKAIETSLRYHPQRQEVESEAHAADERVGVARGALLPQATGHAQYLRATDRGIGNTKYLASPDMPRIQTSGPDATIFSNNYLLGVGASQFLYDFGKVRGLIDQRDAEAAAEHARLRLEDMDLIFQVSEAYFSLLASTQIVKLFQDAVHQREEHLRVAQANASANLKPEVDVYIAKAQLARAQLQLVDAQNRTEDDKVVLDNSMGIGVESSDYHLADVLTYADVTGTLQGYADQAFSSRPDLRMLVEEARAAGAEIVERKSDYFPTFAASASYSARAQGLPTNNNVDFGVVIDWPLFNGFETEHQVAEAKYRQTAITHALEDLRQRIFLEVKSGFLNWQASVKRIHQAEVAVAASRTELELAQKRYEAGLSSILELTDATHRYVEDDVSYVDALYSFSIAKAALDHATAASLGRF